MRNSDHIIFLLGAGASRPAGIPTIPEMTERFLEEPLRLSDRLSVELSNYKNLVSDIQSLAKVTQDYYHHRDLELIMSLILELQDSEFRTLFESKYDEISNIDKTHLTLIKVSGRNVKEYLKSYRKCDGQGEWLILGLCISASPFDAFINYFLAKSC